MSARGLEVRSGVSHAATFEGEFSMSRGPYASKGWRATLGDKGLPVLADSVAEVESCIGPNFW
jgi:hypothetical protein